MMAPPSWSERPLKRTRYSGARFHSSAAMTIATSIGMPASRASLWRVGNLPYASRSLLWGASAAGGFCVSSDIE